MGHGASPGRPPARRDSVQLGLADLWGCQCFQSKSPPHRPPVSPDLSMGGGHPAASLELPSLIQDRTLPTNQLIFTPLLLYTRDSHLSRLLMENRSLPGNREAGTGCCPLLASTLSLLGSDLTPGEGKATHCRILAWRSLHGPRAWWATVHKELDTTGVPFTFSTPIYSDQL